MDTINNIGISFTQRGAKSTAKAIDSVAQALRNLKQIADEFKTSDSVQAAMNKIKPDPSVAQGIRDVKNQIKDLQKTTDGFKTSTVKVNAEMSTMSRIMKGALVLGAIRRVTKTLGKFIDYSAQYTEDINLFNQSMGSYAKEAYSYGQTVSEVMGIDIGEWTRAQGVFQTLAEGFGVSADRAYTMSKNLTQLSYDIASFYNLDTEEAMAKVQSGLAGEIEPMRRIGYDLSKANMMAAAAELGITKTYNAMTQAEKSQLRYYIMMKSVTQVQGDMARTLQNPANMLRIFSAQAHNAARAIGNMFIPALKAVLPIAIAFMKIIANAANFLAALFGFKAPEIGGMEDLETGASDLSDDLDEATGHAKALKKQLAGFDEINNLTTNDGSSGSGDLGGSWANFDLPEYDFLGDATSWIDEWVAKLTPIAGIIAGIVAAFAAWKIGIFLIGGGFTELVAKITGGVGKIFSTMTEHPFLAIISLIIGAIVTLYTTNEDFRNWVNNALKDIWAWLSKLWEDMQPLFKWLGEQIAKIKEWVAKLFEKLKPYFEKAKEYLGAIALSAKENWQKIKDTFAPAAEWFKVIWTAIKDGVTQRWEELKEGAKGAWQGIKEIFAPVGEWFSEKFGDAWAKVKEIFADDDGAFTFDSIKEGIKNVFKDLVNGLIRGINKVLAWPFNKLNSVLNWIKDISVLGVKPFYNLWSYNPIAIPQIPLLAKGGVVDSATMAMIGEDGAEAVVPLENNTGWINALATKINDVNEDNDDSTTILANIYSYIQTMNLSPRVTVDDIGKANDKYNDRKLRIQGV